MFHYSLTLPNGTTTNTSIFYGTDGLFEIRIEFESNVYRIFCCFDEGNLVVLFNGFQKKSQKTPQKEIDKALKIKQEYFINKNKKSRL